MRLLDGARVVSEAVITPSDFQKLASQLGDQPMRASKVGFVAARRAQVAERITTLWNGTETENVAQPGDWIVANLSASREPLRDRSGNLNIYVISADRFPGLYEQAGELTPLGRVYTAKSTVLALRFSGGFDIMTPWGERQTAEDGYLILNDGDVYGNNSETFNATYQISPS